MLGVSPPRGGNDSPQSMATGRGESESMAAGVAFLAGLSSGRLMNGSMRSALRAALLAAGALSAPGCGLLGSKQVEVAAEPSPPDAELRLAALEQEVLRLRQENSVLSERLAMATKASPPAADPAAASPPPLKEETSIALTQPRSAPEIKAETVVAAADADRALASAPSKPVESSPRLVQPSFASQEETVFENEAERDVELASVLFGVHLASYRQADEASAGWARLQRDFPAELGLLEPRLESVTIEGRGEFLRLIGGAFSSAEKAAALCATLKAKGVYCAVTDFGGRKLSPSDGDAG